MPAIPREILEERDRRHAAMRAISEWVEEQRRQERLHTPPWGSIGVGGADFDFLLKAVVGEAYLRALRRGATAEEARDAAAADGDECVRTWNIRTSLGRMSVSGICELIRWNRAGRSEAESVHARFLNMVD